MVRKENAAAIISSTERHDEGDETEEDRILSAATLLVAGFGPLVDRLQRGRLTGPKFLTEMEKPRTELSVGRHCSP